jgi:hypothetical protein
MTCLFLLDYHCEYLELVYVTLARCGCPANQQVERTQQFIQRNTYVSITKNCTIMFVSELMQNR